MAVSGTNGLMQNAAYQQGPVPVHTVTVPRRVVVPLVPTVTSPRAPCWMSGSVRQSITSPALPVHQGPLLAPTVQVRAAGVSTKAPSGTVTASGMLARGLCRQSTGDNLANYFNHGRRRVTEPPPKVAERSPRSPGRREHGVTSLCPEAGSSVEVPLQPASPRGAVQAWGQVEAPGLTRRPTRLHHGPNPMELPSEVGSHRRMSHGEALHLQEAWDALRETLSTSPCRIRSPGMRSPGSVGSPQRALSSDAAHRLSAGVRSCLDGNHSEGEDARRPRPRRRTQQQSTGAVRGMQLQLVGPDVLEENPSGEESAEGFPKGRRAKERRHLSPKAGDGGGDLAHGLKSAVSTSEDTLGLKRRGRRSQGAQERCSRSPGPWDPLPEGTRKKDGWGRFTARPPPSSSSVPRAPYGTDKDLKPRVPAVRRLHSAPPLPYGSDTDVPPPSPPPRGGIPLGLSIPEIPEPGPDASTGGSGGGRGEAAVEPDTGGPGRMSPLSARNWRPALGNRLKTPPRASSADGHRFGKSLMSSTFVERQRQSSSLRGGARRLSSGGNLAPQLNRKLSDQPRTCFQPRPSGLRTRLKDAAKPSGELDEAYNKCLQSISEEIEQLQSRCFRIEREVRKTREENGMLKTCQPQELADSS
ncbi:unnamed protein product [Symbiodinium natans]|uniref:Uncharacterized protein n=1 Tax=Symbiodinium natans TaxID=878477 RepID=A0A812T1D3_9DINO|nr:unnamed protein product [Symbiodinium natans]